MISLALVMAKPDSLLFEVTMSGAQEEDFEIPIYATLTGEDVSYRQQIGPDTRYLTFEGLTPATEYTIRIFNAEKVFVERSYCTAEEGESKGSISADVSGAHATVQVYDMVLKAGQYYTVVATDEDGNNLFSKDSTDLSARYSFSVPEEKSLFFTLSIDGQVCAVASYGFVIEEAEAEEEKPQEPEYDFSNGVWSWSEDHSSASIAFEEKNGGEPLVVSASVASSVTLEPTCEEKGSTLFTASASYEELSFSDEQEAEIEALGHNFGAFTEEVPATCEEAGTGAYCQCSVCGKYFNSSNSETTLDALVLPALGHEYDFAAFVWDGFVAKAQYTCAHDPSHTEYYDATMTNEVTLEPVCEATGIRTYTATFGIHSETKEEVLEALGHEYGEPVFEWTELDEGYSAMLVYICEHDESHRIEVEAEVGHEETPATCTEDAYITYSAFVIYHDEEHGDEKVVTEEESALGHEYGNLIAKNAGCNGLAAHYECSVCHKFFDEDKNETTEEALKLDMASVTVGDETTVYKNFADALSAWVDGSTLTLLNDVIVTDTISVSGGVAKTLDLNGNTITLNSTANEQRVIDVNGNTTVFTLQDSSGNNAGKLTGVSPASDDGWSGALYINSGATVNMYGGTIAGNKTTNGAGVWIDGRGHAGNAVFNMYGGVITGNTATNGGGVYVGCQLNETAGTAQFNLYGGTVSGNNATNGKDVIVDKGVLTIKGAPTIGGVYLLSGKKIAVAGALSNTTPISVTMQTIGVFTTGWYTYMGNTDPSNYFTSPEEYSFRLTEGEAELYEETGGDSPDISLEEGAIYINPNGYARSESDLSSNPTEFTSSADSPYLIKDQEVSGCDNIIQVIQTDSSLATANIYIKLSNVSLSARSWASLFRIEATNTINITLIIEGNVTFSGGSGQQIFSSQGYGGATVNIIIDQTKAGGTFNAEVTDGLTHAETGTINVSYK